MNKIEFLEARLAEDEAVIAEVDDQFAGIQQPQPGLYVDSQYYCGDRIISMNVKYARAEIAAKRAIIAEYVEAHDPRGNEPYWGYIDGVREVVNMVISTLVAVYSDHPDFEPEWLVTI